MKLQLSGNRNNYTPYGGLSPLAKQDGKGRGNWYSQGGDQVSTRQKKGSSNQNQTKKISPRQGDNNVGPSSLRKGEPGKQVWVDNVEALASAKNLRGEDTITLAQHIHLNQEWGTAANCEWCWLIFKLSCDKETISAKLILVVETNSQHSTITAIFATDPSNPWSWSVTFDTAATKQIYETRNATLVKDFEGVTYTYRLRAKGAANQVLVTLQSISLIPDGELALCFRRFGVVKKVVRQSHAFNHQIDKWPKAYYPPFEWRR